MNMSEKEDNVSRETPPLGDLGPIVRLDPDILEDRLKRMSEKDRKKLMNLLDRNVVILERGAK